MKVVLLDRDGTVVVEPPDFSVRLEGLRLFPDSLEAMTKLAQADVGVIFVTNQTSLANGSLTMEEYDATNEKMLELLKPSGVNVLKIYLCPHGPNDGCDCRKPRPGMLLDAAQEFDINLPETYMVGDRVTDIEAGIAASTKTILVPQGNFHDTTAKADFIADNLSEAVDYILNDL